jgi:hypothetical protein
MIENPVEMNKSTTRTGRMVMKELCLVANDSTSMSQSMLKTRVSVCLVLGVAW